MAGFLAGAVFFSPSEAMPATGSAVNVSAIVVPPPPPDPDIVDDFNDANDLNYWEGTMGVMEPVVGDNSIVHSFETVGALGGSGNSLKLSYNLDQASDWNGYFLKLNNDSAVTKNLSNYRQLSFWIKGAVGGVEHLKIGMGNASGDLGRNSASLYVTDYLDGGITTGWQKVSIPLEAFANLDSKTNATTVTFVFERAYADVGGLSRSGAVFIDDVRFLAVALDTLRIDHFGDNWGWSAMGGNTGDGGNNGATASHSLSNVLGTYPTFPRSFKSVYDVTPAGSFSYHFIMLGGGIDGWTAVPVDCSAYRYLVFSARAQSALENPIKFKIEVKSSGKVINLIVSGLTPTFQKYYADLSILPTFLIDRTTINQITITYENVRVTNKVGVVYFDDIGFSNTLPTGGVKFP